MTRTKNTSATKRKAPRSNPSDEQSVAAPENSEPQKMARPKPSKAPIKTTKDDDAEKKKEKLIRDSFTLPESDYSTIKQLKERCLSAGIEVKKSEIVRVALNALAQQTDKKLIGAVKALPRIKTGRPKKSR